jgi:hypothetical protein
LVTLRESVLRVLRGKFGEPLPADLSAAVAAQADAGELARWLDLAVAAATPEQFLAAVMPAPGQPDGVPPPGP